MGDSMTLQYDGVRPAVEGTLEGDTWTTTARNVWEGGRLLQLPGAAAAVLWQARGLPRELGRQEVPDACQR